MTGLRKTLLAASLVAATFAAGAAVVSAQDAADGTVVGEPKIMLAPQGGGAPDMSGEDAFHNDYPTNVRADYVFGCMQVNGNTRLELDRCSCSVDVIASVLPYKEYEEAETVLSVRQKGGENVAFLYTPQMSEKVKKLKRAQIEGELRCF
jgi:hypothetical protein